MLTKDLGTNKEQHITITTASSMSDDEIEKAVKEAQEYEAQDKKRKEAVDARNEADSFATNVERTLEEVGDKVSADEKAKVQEDLDAVKKLLEETKNQEPTEAQVADLKAAKEKLMATSQSLFSKLYEGQQAQGAQAGSDMNANANADAGAQDDVVDGNYREV